MTQAEFARVKHHAIQALESLAITCYTIGCDNPIGKTALEGLLKAQELVSMLMDDHEQPNTK